jgi:hypothetical protein
MATYKLSEDGVHYDTIEASDLDAAEKVAREQFDASVYGTINGTAWIDIWIRNTDDGDDRKVTIRVDPEEPDCLSGEDHDWQAPYELLGGLEENPGVWGRGGGIISQEVCMRCGCGRTTDTWAQRRDTGEQGLTSVRYEPGKFAFEVMARS